MGKDLVLCLFRSAYCACLPDRYSLAFFSMGLAVSLESRRASELHLVWALRPRAGLGVPHSIYEWLGMFRRMATQMPKAMERPCGWSSFI
jgi:hypothetical protein